MVDFEVDPSVLEDYFREDNNFQVQVEKRDDQKEVTYKDDGEAPETAREEQFDREDAVQYNSDDDESESEDQEWSPEEEAMYQMYCVTHLRNERASTSSSNTTLNNSLADDDETDESEPTNFFTKIKEKESEKPSDLPLSEEEDENDTEIIEKADIEESEKSLLLKAIQLVPSSSESCK